MRKFVLAAVAAAALLGAAGCTGPDKSNMPESEPAAAAPAPVENAAPAVENAANATADNATGNATNAASDNATGG